MDADPFAPLGNAPPMPETETKSDGWQAVMPAPLPLPGDIRHSRHGAPSQVWEYRDADGALLFAVARFDPSDRKKEIRPYSCGPDSWRWKAPPEPRPLYGLPDLTARPDAPVLIVEGEKAADAAKALFPDWVPVTWQGGSAATGKADWAALAGRRVVIWPDADAPGRKAAEAVRRALDGKARSVAVVDVPNTWPDGWDLADVPPAGVTIPTLRDMVTDAQRAADAVAAMPRGFTMRADGVYWTRPDDSDASPLQVCGSLRVTAVTNDGNGHAWGRLLEWEDADGKRHQWAMPAAMLAGDGTEIRVRLLDGGLFVAPGRKPREMLAAYLGQSAPPERVRVVPRLGWHVLPGGWVFVLPDGVIGGTGAGRVMLQTDRPDALPPLVQAGTLAEWQKAVARLAVGNSRLAFALSIAFAPPLVALIGTEGGGFHFRGPTSRGKSTALHAAGSVWGGGGLHGWVRSWRATDNGLETVATAHNDLPLILDEMGEAAPEAVAAAAYMLANGVGKSRADRDGSARRAAEWRGLFLSSGEVGIADRLAEARGGPMRVRPGQEVRVLDVPADPGPHGLFETLHGFQTAAALADAVKAGAARYYGVAGRAWLEALANDPAGRATAAREVIDGFVKQHVPPGADGQVRRAGGRFALVAAAGEMAAGLGILPWEAGEAERAAAACFRAWIATRTGGTGSAEDARAIEAVRRFIMAHGESRFQTIGGKKATKARPVANRAGWRKSVDGVCHYLIPRDIWANEVLPGLDAAAAAKVLRARGFLIPQSESDPRNTRMERVGLPNSVRVYIVSDAILAGADGSDESEP